MRWRSADPVDPDEDAGSCDERARVVGRIVAEREGDQCSECVCTKRMGRRVSKLDQIRLRRFGFWTADLHSSNRRRA